MIIVRNARCRSKIRFIVINYNNSELLSFLERSAELKWYERIMTSMELKISETLTHLLDERRTTLKHISLATGVPLSTLSEWKASNRNPNTVQVAKVAKHLAVTVHYLLFGTEDSEEPIQKILKEEFFKGTFEITLKRVKILEEK
jgi:transcriptional regulator with XRE-family HTH domain